MSEPKPRKYACVQWPRECRMPFLRQLDRLAFVLGKVEGAEHAPSAEAFAKLVDVLQERIDHSPLWKKHGASYRPSLWLQTKEQTATPIDQIVEELGIA